MKIVGTGCGPGMLTMAAAAAIRSARVMYGSRRAISLVSDIIPPGCEVHALTDFRGIPDLPGDAVVLSTGDPMLAGLGFAGAEIIPGISSLQLTCARMGLPLERVVTVAAHGRDHDAAAKETVNCLNSGKIVCIIADPAFTPAYLSRHLAVRGIETGITLCEDLGYPEETITHGTSLDPPEPHSRLFIFFAGSW